MLGTAQTGGLDQIPLKGGSGNSCTEFLRHDYYALIRRRTDEGTEPRRPAAHIRRSVRRASLLVRPPMQKGHRTEQQPGSSRCTLCPMPPSAIASGSSTRVSSSVTRFIPAAAGEAARHG
jgi:hypothetical protein